MGEIIFVEVGGEDAGMPHDEMIREKTQSEKQRWAVMLRRLIQVFYRLLHNFLKFSPIFRMKILIGLGYLYGTFPYFLILFHANAMMKNIVAVKTMAAPEAMLR